MTEFFHTIHPRTMSLIQPFQNTLTNTPYLIRPTGHLAHKLRTHADDRLRCAILCTYVSASHPNALATAATLAVAHAVALTFAHNEALAATLAVALAIAPAVADARSICDDALGPSLQNSLAS